MLISQGVKYSHPDNRDKPYVDWRLPENRQECFFKWLNWRLKGRNLDHFNWNLSYMNTSKSPTGLPMTRNQKIWYSYLFGMTYQSSMAWIFYWNFPNLENINLTDLDKWNRETLSRQKFATDTRYNKGHIVKMVTSLLEWVNREGQGDIGKAFDKFLENDENQSFHNINQQIQTFHKFGRMTSWLCAQTLYECVNLPIKPNTMFTSDPSNVSVWNGMMWFSGHPEKTVGDPPKYAGYTPTALDKQNMQQQELELMAEAQDWVQDKKFLSFFTLETHLCQFKKLNVGYDYPGQNIGDAINRYHCFKNTWPEIDFSAFDDAMNHKDFFPEIAWNKESRELKWLFNKTGQLINMNNLYPEMPCMYKELAIPRNMFKKDFDEGHIKGIIDEYSNGLPMSNLTKFIG